MESEFRLMMAVKTIKDYLADLHAEHEPCENCLLKVHCQGGYESLCRGLWGESGEWDADKWVRQLRNAKRRDKRRGIDNDD